MEDVRLNELKAQIRLQQTQSQISRLEEEIRKTEEALSADKVRIINIYNIESSSIVI